MTLHKPRAKRPRSSMAAALSLALSVASAQDSASQSGASASQSGASASDILARCEALATATTSTAALEDVQAPSEVLAVVGESEWTALRDVAKVGVLWEYGYVLSGSSSRLLKVYTRCSSSSSSSSGSGVEMSEIAVSQAAFSSVCGAADCGAFSQATNAECDEAGLSAALQCAVDVEDQNVSSSSASVWSSAASSSAIPYPQAFRHNVSFNSTDSTNLVGIHMRATDAGVACTTSGDTIVPCFRLQDTVESSTFCRPTVDTTRVTAFLSAMSTIVAAQSTPSSDGSVFTGSTASESTSSPSSLSLAVAIAAGVIVLLLFVLGYCCLRRRRKRSASANEANTVAMQAVGRRTDGGPERAQSRQRRWSTRPSWFGTLLGGGSERGRESTLNPTMRGRRSSSVGYGKTVEEYCAESADLTMFLNDTRIFTKRVAYEELTFLRLLAKGAFGEVWLGQLETQHVAIKKLLPERAHNTAHLEQFAAEIQLMAALEHPSVVSLLGVSWTRRLDTLSAVVEYMDGGDLDAALRRKGSQLSWRREKMRVAMDVAEGLVYLHCLRPVIVHRDLKSKNVLLSKTWRAKLSDFGVSRHAAVNETLTSGVGTLLWTAPEIVEGKKYSEKADIYSLGVVLSELDTAKPPFSHILNPDAETPGERLPAMQIARLVKLGKARVELRDDCPDALRQLALDCTALDPDRRPSAMQVAFTLKSIIAPALAQQGDSDEHQANGQVVPTPAS